MDYKFTGYNAKLKNRPKALRKGMTPQEKHLWYDFLKSYPVQFYRQRIIDIYFADFYRARAKPVIEPDGLQLFSESGIRHDEYRTYLMNQFGIEVIRYSNSEVESRFSDICREIDNKVRWRISSLNG